MQLHIAGPFEAGRRRERGGQLWAKLKRRKLCTKQKIAVDPPEPKQITKAGQRQAPRRIWEDKLAHLAVIHYSRIGRRQCCLNLNCNLKNVTLCMLSSSLQLNGDAVCFLNFQLLYKAAASECEPHLPEINQSMGPLKFYPRSWYPNFSFVRFSCPGSSILTLLSVSESLSLLNFDTKNDFWHMIPFRHLIRVMSRRKDRKTKIEKAKYKRTQRTWELCVHSSLTSYCQVILWGSGC